MLVLVSVVFGTVADGVEDDPWRFMWGLLLCLVIGAGGVITELLVPLESIGDDAALLVSHGFAGDSGLEYIHTDI